MHATPRLQQGLCVRANSMVIGFQLRASFGEPADDSGERLAAVPSETTQMIGRPMRGTAPSSTTLDFLSPVIEVFGIVWISAALSVGVPVQGCLQFKGINSDHMPP